MNKLIKTGVPFWRFKDRDIKFERLCFEENKRIDDTLNYQILKSDIETFVFHLESHLHDFKS